MSTSYMAKNSIVQTRQLQTQEICAVVNVVAGTSDLPSNIVIVNSTIADSTIEIDVKETVSKVFLAQVLNKTTGANIALEAVSISGTKVTLQIDGTGISSACVVLKYQVAE